MPPANINANINITKPETLPDHPVFLRLKDKDRDSLLKSAEFWQIPANTKMFYPGDSSESLVLVHSGLLITTDQESNKTHLYFPGDIWGPGLHDNEQSGFINEQVEAFSDTTILLWPLEFMQNMMGRSHTFRRRIRAKFDRKNNLLSGLPLLTPITGKNMDARKIPVSLRQIIPGTIAAILLSLAGTLIPFFNYPGNPIYQSSQAAWVIPVIILALFVLWITGFLLKRFFHDYRISPNIVSVSTIQWFKLFSERRRIPVQQIQGVEVQKNSFTGQLFNYGSIIIKTSAPGGNIIMNNITDPIKIAETIRKYVAKNKKHSGTRNQETIRRKLEASGLNPTAPRLILPGTPSPDSLPLSSTLQFKKSIAILAGQLTIPFLIMILCILSIITIRKYLPGITPGPLWFAFLLPLALTWYRIEDWRNDSYSISNTSATDRYRKPLGMGETINKVDLLSLQNIRTIQKGFLSFLFRYGDVVLITPGGSSDITFTGVSHPWRIQEVLFRRRAAILRNQELKTIEKEQDNFVTFSKVLKQISS